MKSLNCYNKKIFVYLFYKIYLDIYFNISYSDTKIFVNQTNHCKFRNTFNQKSCDVCKCFLKSMRDIFLCYFFTFNCLLLVIKRKCLKTDIYNTIRRQHYEN